MKKSIIFSLLLAYVTLSWGQQSQTLSLYNTNEYKSKTGITGNFYTNSTAFTSRFVNPFINGGPITEKMKGDVEKRLSPLNRAGMELNYGAFFSTKIDSMFKVPKYHLNLFVAVANRSNYNLRFSEDLFRLGFYGNKSFAGDTAKLGDFQLNQLRYQQLQIGLISNDGLGNIFGLGISYLKGEFHQSIDAPLINFFTSDIGDEIDLNSEIYIQQSDTNNLGISAFNGHGVSVDFYYEKDFEVFNNQKQGKGTFRLDINDIGFINWNSQSLDYTIDTSLHFEGLYINNVFQLEDSIIQQDIDSLTAPYQNNEKNGSYSTFLPASLGLTVRQEFEKHIFTIGLRYKHFANYLPYVFISHARKFNETYTIGGRISYGGYGRLGAGFYFAVNHKTFNAKLGFSNLEAVALPDNTLGYAGYLTLAKYF